MHGSIGTSCAVADVQRGPRDHLVVDAGGVSAAQQRRRCCSGCRPDDVRVDLHARLRLLRHQRRRHRVVRRGAAVAGRRPAGARAALAARTRWRGRTTASRTSSISASALDAARRRSSRGTTRRGRRRSAAVPATTRPGNVVTGIAGRLRSRRRSRRDRRRRRPPRFNNGSNAAPSYVTGCAGGRVRRHRDDQERARADAHDSVAVLHRPAALAEPAAEHVRARVVHGRDRRARQGRSGRVSAAPPARSAADRRREGGGEGGELGGAAVAAAGRVRAPASRSGRGIACVLYEGDNGYCAMVAEVDVDQDTGRHRRHAARRRRRTAGRSRIRTA